MLKQKTFRLIGAILGFAIYAYLIFEVVDRFINGGDPFPVLSFMFLLTLNARIATMDRKSNTIKSIRDNWRLN